MEGVVTQLVQILGSLLILFAFAASQRNALSPDSPAYLALNLVGSAVLAVLAAHEHQWGFLLLESSWALVSGWALIRVSCHGRAKPSGDTATPPRTASTI
jgi:hypothetical protein